MDNDLWWVWFDLRQERLNARRTATVDLLATLTTWTQDAWVRCTELEERACVLLDDVACSTHTYRTSARVVAVPIPVPGSN